MTPQQLSSLARTRRSMLCVGIDPDSAKLPAGVGVGEFCKRIIEATADLAIAYKVNFAFFEAMGPRGWDLLAEVAAQLPADTLRIADAKRGDIGNTSTMYATAAFGALPFDAITVSPYMGSDSVTPFLQQEGKWVFLLALTSNPGAADFQFLPQADGQPLYRHVVRTSQRWPSKGHLGFVTGATQASHLADIRQDAPSAWFLVPGVGAQGGDLEAVCNAAATPEGGLLINASRSILYASNDPLRYPEAARQAAQELATASGAFLR